MINLITIKKIIKSHEYLIIAVKSVNDGCYRAYRKLSFDTGPSVTCTNCKLHIFHVARISAKAYRESSSVCLLFADEERIDAYQEKCPPPHTLARPYTPTCCGFRTNLCTTPINRRP